MTGHAQSPPENQLLPHLPGHAFASLRPSPLALHIAPYSPSSLGSVQFPACPLRRPTSET